MFRAMSRPIRHAAGALSTLLPAVAAHAHAGHGLPGISHWHGSDTLGFLLVLALIGAALWVGGRK